MGRMGATMLRVVLVFVVAALGFALLQDSVRAIETWASVRILELFGSDGVKRVDATSLLVISGHHPAFHVLITPSCSSLASLLAFGCLGPLTPRRPIGRRAAAIAVAAGLVASGNIIRIACSVFIGLVAGRASLVLFHDWVGSMFTFVYTIGGYILMLALLLPKSRGNRSSKAERVAPWPEAEGLARASIRIKRRRLLTTGAVACALLIALVAVASPAPALDDYPYKAEDPAVADSAGFLYRHCTSFVAWRLGQRGPFEARMTGPNGVHGEWGHADSWADNAVRIGFGVDTTPARGAVAHWHAGEEGASGMGHVALVAEVHADGSVDVEEYNGANRYAYGRVGPLRAPRYIHIYDDATAVARDESPPAGRVTSPAPGWRLLSGQVMDVQGVFEDATGVAHVTFFVADDSYDYRAIGTDDEGDGAYSVRWRVDYPPGSSLNFMVEAVDVAGNIGIDSVQGVEVVPVGGSDGRGS